MIFENLRYKIANVVLRRKQAKVNRQKALYDFASAKHLGLVSSIHNEADAACLKEFLHYLSRRAIKYTVFGYIVDSKIPENFLYLKDMDFITRENLNFLFIPNTPNVQKFIDNPFDILICCNVSNFFPVEYIAQLSLAKCKVGIKQDHEYGYDLTIDISKERTIEYFLKNLVIYLSNLRNSN